MPMEVRIEPTEIESVLEVHTGLVEDERGSFSESYSAEMWSRAGFKETFVQDNLSRSARGTLRGMHYQINPAGMGKLVRCVSGAIFDVAVDLRKSSKTFGKHFAIRLSEKNCTSIFIPPGFAHGFQSLKKENIVCYSCTEYRSPNNERSLKYDDPKLNIKWPSKKPFISLKDKNAENFDSLIR